MTIHGRIRLALEDITRLEVDAVVTAANEFLAGGGGVDGAVHAAAGPELVLASRQLAPCPPGEARITPGFKLNVMVIHAVGPIYRGGNANESNTLASAYRASLALAAENRLKHIAIPSISTGVYRYPQEEACRTAIEVVVDWIRGNESPEIVTFCCYHDVDHEMYRERLAEVGLIDDA